MIKGKMAGIVIGGFTGYLLVNKALNVIRSGMQQMASANMWKNYYKYGKDGNMVPPGYSMHSHTGEDGTPVTVEKDKTKQDASKTAENSPVMDAIAEAIRKSFGGSDEAREAKEGQTEASEAGDICPQDCDACEVEKCPFANLKQDGKITKWDENGKPVAGRYSWEKDKGTELNWAVVHNACKGDTDGDDIQGAMRLREYVKNMRVKGMDDKAIADSLDIPLSELRKRIHEAIVTLRDEEDSAEDNRIQIANDVMGKEKEEENDDHETVD